MAETFLAAARKEIEDYRIQDTKKLLEIVPDFGVDIGDRQKLDAA